MTQFGRLRGKLAEVCDLRGAAASLAGSANDMRQARPGQVEQLATLERLSHETFISAEVGN
jgi:hypothetical protein